MRVGVNLRDGNELLIYLYSAPAQWFDYFLFTRQESLAQRVVVLHRA